MMDELLAQFLIEGRDLIAEAEGHLGLLAGSGNDPAAIDGAFRAVHTLKGSVAIFDMAPAERVLHAAEDLLDTARKSGAGLSSPAIAQLVAAVDQTARWIDEMEAHGALLPGAAEIAAGLGGGGAAAAAEVVAEPEAEAEAEASWLGELLARVAADARDGAQVAFRYTPDPDCFFRGDDPLAIVEAVPELAALTLLRGEGWPDFADWDPFRCHLVIEGLSRAGIDAVRGAFRLVPDQVAFASVEAEAVPQSETLGEAGAASRVLRVEAGRLDRLADGVGELLVAANSLTPLAERAEALDPALAAGIRAAQAEVERVVGEVHRSVSAVRQVPLAASLRRLPRMAREIAGGLGKAIRLELRGETIEADKEVADGLFEPLLHLLRNAIDHGIEPPELRAAAGKPAEGVLALTVARQGASLVVTLRDDGRGIDPHAIRAAAVGKGMLGPQEAAQLDDAAALRLIFAAGFSTAAAVTDVSGRGVGMDVVQAAAERMRGRIEVESQVGAGTSFRLVVPLDAITTRLLVVQAGADRYGVRLDQIAETARVASDRLVPLGLGTACVLRDRTVPVLSLAALLGGEARRQAVARLLVTQAAGAPLALEVDGFGGRIDAVVRAKSGILAGVRHVAGTTLLGDGGVLLVLDLPELIG